MRVKSPWRTIQMNSAVPPSDKTPADHSSENHSVGELSQAPVPHHGRQYAGHDRRAEMLNSARRPQIGRRQRRLLHHDADRQRNDAAKAHQDRQQRHIADVDAGQPGESTSATPIKPTANPAQERNPIGLRSTSAKISAVNSGCKPPISDITPAARPFATAHQLAAR